MIRQASPKLQTVSLSKVVRSLHEIKRRGAISKAELARSIEVSPPTAAGIIDGLTEEGLVTWNGRGSSTGGRPPELVSLDMKNNYVVAIEFTSKSIHGAITNLGAEIISMFKLPTSSFTDFHTIIDRAYTVIRTLLENMSLSEDEILGIGMAISGIVNQQSNRVEFSPHYGWRDIDLISEMAKHTSVPVCFDNISQVKAIGELHFGLGRQHRNFLSVRIGSGIGAAIVIDGAVFHGAHGVAGEFGHIFVESALDLQCICGKKGCLETVASLRGIKNILRTIFESDTDTTLFDSCDGDAENLTFRILGNHYVGGDPVAGQIVTRMLSSLGISISNLVQVLDPEVVVITGEFVTGGEEFVDLIRKTIHAQAISQSLPFIEVRSDSFHDRESIVGATALVLDSVLRREILGIRCGQRINDEVPDNPLITETSTNNLP